MLRIITIVFLTLFTHFQAKCQEVVNNRFLKEISVVLRDHTVGSGFSVVVFSVKKGVYKVLSVTSSNSRTKRIIDSAVAINSSGFRLTEEADGYYALPIVQAAYDESKDELNWNNSSYWNMAGFGKEFRVPAKTVFLKPLMTVSSLPIKN